MFWFLADREANRLSFPDNRLPATDVALKQTAARVTRVALVFNPQSAPYADLFLRPVEAAAPSFSVAPIAAPVRDPADVDRVFDALAREPNGGLIVFPDISMTNYREAIISLAARHRVPAIYPFRFFAESGGLMSYGTDVAEVFRRAAGYVDHIIRAAARHRLPAIYGYRQTMAPQPE
jgi:putative tryptophan/tyrosine transport system substrate-binding protein